MPEFWARARGAGASKWHCASGALTRYFRATSHLATNVGIQTVSGGMMTKRLALLVGILALGLLFHSALARAQAPPGPIPQAQEQLPPDAAPQAESKIVTAYTLPPDVYAKTEHLSKIRLAFILIGTIYGLIILWLIIRLRL